MEDDEEEVFDVNEQRVENEILPRSLECKTCDVMLVSYLLTVVLRGIEILLSCEIFDHILSDSLLFSDFHSIFGI